MIYQIWQDNLGRPETVSKPVQIGWFSLWVGQLSISLSHYVTLHLPLNTKDTVLAGSSAQWMWTLLFLMFETASKFCFFCGF